MAKFRSTKSHRLVRIIKKSSVSLFVVSAFLGYAAHMQQGAFENAKTEGLPNRIQITSRSLPGAYRDGVYTGSVVKAGYGKVQVRAVIHNGKISEIQFLDYPHDLRTSQKINSRAMPWLQQEAIQGQNAKVDIVSGATVTSQAFAASLQAALDSAQN